MGKAAETTSAISSVWTTGGFPDMLPGIVSVFPFAALAGFLTSAWNCLALSLSWNATTPAEITVRLASVGETTHGRPQWRSDAATHRCRNGHRAQCGAVLAHGHVRTPPGFRRSV